MKVITVIPTLELAGAEVMCKNLVLELNNKNYEVIVVSLYNRETIITQLLKDKGIRVIFLDKKPGFDITIISKLKRIFINEKPNVIHTHLDSLKYSFVAAKMAGNPRCVHTMHNLAEKESGRIARIINKIAFRYAGVVPVALSNEIQRSIMAVYKLEKKDVPIIYNGIDINECVPKTDYNVNESKVIFINVARFMYQKNHEMLIESYKKLTEQVIDTELWLVGRGELLGKIKEHVEKLHISNQVRFWGERTDVLALLNKADVFVLPSLYEGMPMTIIEAMGTGLPVIATSVGGIPEMVENGVTGYLIECNEDELAQAMKKMYFCDKRKDMGKKAIKISKDKFSVVSMTNEYCKLYDSL